MNWQLVDWKAAFRYRKKHTFRFKYRENSRRINSRFGGEISINGGPGMEVNTLVLHRRKNYYFTNETESSMLIIETKHSRPMYTVSAGKTVSVFTDQSFPTFFYFRYTASSEALVSGVVISPEDGGLIVNK